jgi:hypothetical protein
VIAQSKAGRPTPAIKLEEAILSSSPTLTSESSGVAVQILPNALRKLNAAWFIRAAEKKTNAAADAAGTTSLSI